MVYQVLSEHLLLKKCSAGDSSAFKELYDRYKENVLNTVMARVADADDATDITQDIFIDLWLQKEMLVNVTDFRIYLFVFSRNHVVSAYRRKNIRIKNENYLIERIAALDHSPEDHRFADELLVQINDVLDNFPETMRHCYQLSKNEGKKNPEIANLLNISEKTVRNNVSEALKRLRLTLSKSHPELLFWLIYLLLFWLPFSKVQLA